jgi:hypothetical protein
MYYNQLDLILIHLFLYLQGIDLQNLCIAIGSKPTSQHSEGKAADIEVVNVDNKELAEWIRDNLEFDQLNFRIL